LRVSPSHAFLYFYFEGCDAVTLILHFDIALFVIILVKGAFRSYFYKSLAFAIPNLCVFIVELSICFGFGFYHLFCFYAPIVNGLVGMCPQVSYWRQKLGLGVPHLISFNRSHRALECFICEYFLLALLVEL